MQKELVSKNPNLLSMQEAAEKAISKLSPSQRDRFSADSNIRTEAIAAELRRRKEEYRKSTLGKERPTLHWGE